MKAISLINLLLVFTQVAHRAQGGNDAIQADPGNFSNVLKALNTIQSWDFVETRFNTLDEDDNIRIVQEYLDKHWSHYTEKIYSVFLSNTSIFMEEESTQCMRDMQHVLKGLRRGDSWALEMADASGKPSPSMRKFVLSFVGDYGQCRDVRVPMNKEHNVTGFDGRYCETQLLYFRQFLMKWHLCWPDSCSEKEITILTYKGVLKSDLLPFVVPFNTDCKTSRDDRDKIGATYVSIVSLSIITLLVVVGTSLDIYLNVMQDEDANTIESKIEETSTLLNKKGYIPYVFKLRNVCLCFSLYTNGKRLLTSEAPKDPIDCIFGLRVVNLYIVIVLNYFIVRLPFSDSYLNGVKDIKDNWVLDISTFYIAVDGFFTISGFLLAYYTTEQISQQGWRNYNWWRFYFCRLLTISPPYFLTFFLVWGLARFIGYGAMWIDHNHLECADSWWTNILYINNLVHKKEDCLPHMWYMAVDMQLFWISPLLLIPLAINFQIGIAWNLIVMAGGMIAIGIVTLADDIPATFFAFDTAWLTRVLLVPYNHFGPYILGILSGYFMSLRREKIQMTKYMVATGWILAFTIWLFIHFGHRFDTESWLLGEHKGANTLVNMFSRPVYGTITCWVIIACMSGYGGFINTVLSCQPMKVLGQLTLLIYLIHTPVIEVFFGNSEQNYQWNNWNHVFGICSVLLTSTLLAFLLSLLIELPMVALEKLLFFRNTARKVHELRLDDINKDKPEQQ